MKRSISEISKKKKLVSKTTKIIKNEDALLIQPEPVEVVAEKPKHNFGMKRREGRRIVTSSRTNLRKLEDEEWRKVDFLNNKFAISSYGRLKSFRNNPDGVILKPVEINGFLSVSLSIKGVRRRYMIHKLVAHCFVPKESDELTRVTHLDWNLLNNHFSNLQWLTQKESFSRTFKYLSEKSRKVPKKLPTHSEKLDEDSVKKLKQMLAGGVRQNIIAKFFNLSEMQITRIKRGENWGHIKIDEIE